MHPADPSYSPEQAGGVPDGISRRDLFRWGAQVGAGVALTALTGCSDPSLPSPTQELPEGPRPQPNLPATSIPETDTDTPNAEAPADLEKARHDFAEIRTRLGVTDANYWLADRAPAETLKALRLSGIQQGGFLHPDTGLLPIFPAAVNMWSGAIEGAANKYGVPANMLGIIATMESAGLVDAVSEAGAVGMFQIMITYAKNPNRDLHGNEVRAIIGNPDATYDQVADKLKDPTIAAQVAAKILKEYHDIAVGKNQDLNPDSLWTWGHALAAYNGGPSVAGVDLEADPSEISIQSALYGMNGIRLMFDAALAAEMKKLGYADGTIRRAMVSNELDAQAYAYRQAKEPYLDPRSLQNGAEKVMDAFVKGWVQAGTHQDNPMVASLTKYYNQYKAGDFKWDLDLPPALRVLLCLGLAALFAKSPDNLDPAKYPS